MLSTYETGIVMFLKECSCKVQGSFGRELPWPSKKVGQMVVTRDIFLKLPELKKKHVFLLDSLSSNLCKHTTHNADISCWTCPVSGLKVWDNKIRKHPLSVCSTENILAQTHLFAGNCDHKKNCPGVYAQKLANGGIVNLVLALPPFCKIIRCM